MAENRSLSESPARRHGAAAVALAESALAGLRGGIEAIVSRRGMALTVAGGFVVALAWVGERDSAWGFPMLVAGALMIGLGLLGPRLSGSVALRWGDDGAFFQLTSTVAPPGKRHRAPELAAAEPDLRAAGGELRDELIPPTEIEGDAETIDFKASVGPGTEPDPETG